MSLHDHRESLRHLSKADLLDLAHLHAQHKPLDRLLYSLAIIFDKPPTLASYQSFLSDQNLFERIINLSPSDFTPSILEKLKPTLEDPSLSELAVKQVSVPGYHILKWLRMLYDIAGGKEVLEDKVVVSEEKVGKGLNKEIDEQMLEKEMEKMDIIPREKEEFEIPASLDDLNVENRNVRATEFKTEYQLAQNLLDEVISECWQAGSLGINNPSEKVQKLLKAMCILLGEEATWENGRKILADCENFNKKARSLDMDNLPTKRVNAVRVLLQDPDLRMTNIEMDAPELVKVLMWITTVVNYCMMGNYIESGDAGLSSSAEEDAIKQESKIIETFSKLLDEGGSGEKLTNEEKARLRELEKMGSLDHL